MRCSCMGARGHPRRPFTGRTRGLDRDVAASPTPAWDVEFEQAGGGHDIAVVVVV